jgi:hypothetical protein
MPYNTPTLAQAPALLALAEKLNEAAEQARKIPATNTSVAYDLDNALDLVVEIYLHALGVPFPRRVDLATQVTALAGQGLATVEQAIESEVPAELRTWEIPFDPTRVRARLSKAGREAIAERLPRREDGTADLLAALQNSIDRHKARGSEHHNA